MPATRSSTDSAAARSPAPPVVPAAPPSAATGGTAEAAFAGPRTASTVSRTPNIPAATQVSGDGVRERRTGPRSAVPASTVPTVQSPVPSSTPATDAPVPSSSPWRRISRRTCARSAPTHRSRASWRARWARTTEKVLPTTMRATARAISTNDSAAISTAP